MKGKIIANIWYYCCYVNFFTVSKIILFKYLAVYGLLHCMWLWIIDYIVLHSVSAQTGYTVLLWKMQQSLLFLPELVDPCSVIYHTTSIDQVVLEISCQSLILLFINYRQVSISTWCCQPSLPLSEWVVCQQGLMLIKNIQSSWSILASSHPS